MREQLMRLYGQMAWADARVLERLRDTPLADAVRLLAHVLGAEQVWLGRLRDGDLAAPVTYRNSAGAEYSTAVHDVLTHVALHGSYHRGQINARLRDGGAEPVYVDYIGWVREGAPFPLAPEHGDG